MTHRSLVHAHLRPAAATLLLALCAGGCHDANRDPMAVVLAEETHPALSTRVGLPALPDLVARTGLDSQVDASALWMGSWDLGGADGRRARSDAYARAAGPLGRALGAEGVDGVLSQVDDAVRAVSALDAESLSGGLRVDVERVVALRDESRAAMSSGDRTTALARALESADGLREAGPQAVAGMLVARAEARLEAQRGDDDGSGDRAIERAERLLQGARLALEEEDWARAVRRAYYACQLLGVDPR